MATRTFARPFREWRSSSLILQSEYCLGTYFGLPLTRLQWHSTRPWHKRHGVRCIHDGRIVRGRASSSFEQHDRGSRVSKPETEHRVFCTFVGSHETAKRANYLRRSSSASLVARVRCDLKLETKDLGMVTLTQNDGCEILTLSLSFCVHPRVYTFETELWRVTGSSCPFTKSIYAAVETLLSLVSRLKYESVVPYSTTLCTTIKVTFNKSPGVSGMKSYNNLQSCVFFCFFLLLYFEVHILIFWKLSFDLSGFLLL